MALLPHALSNNAGTSSSREELEPTAKTGRYNPSKMPTGGAPGSGGHGCGDRVLPGDHSRRFGTHRELYPVHVLCFHLSKYMTTEFRIRLSLASTWLPRKCTSLRQNSNDNSSYYKGRFNFPVISHPRINSISVNLQ